FIVLLGGVSLGQVLQALLVVAATVLAAGSLGSLVALWRERTFQALALTTLFLVLYLCLARGLGVLPDLFPGLNGFDAVTWQRRLGPFAATQSVQAPEEAVGAGLAPAYGFAATMVLLSVGLNGLGLWKLRVWNPSGEPIMQRERPEDIDAKDAELAKDET